jgi:PhoH-like ATPase
MRMNEFLLFPEGRMFRITAFSDGQAQLESTIDHTKEKNDVLGLNARNEEQSAALALLTDPDVDLVALLGPAGTGKTLMTIAAAMKQILDEDLYDQMLFTRATVPLGEDIGFLPGNEQEKVSPWLGALWDNIDVLVENHSDSEIEQQRLRDQVKGLVEVKAITFMRGRTFYRKFVVIDEAQNLTPKQMKALVTRAGEGTKLVCLGNLAQIDSPYLSETSSGLAYLVERFKDWPHFGALVLDKGERSRLATEGNIRL